MDFASLIKGEIAKATGSTSTASTNPRKTYMKRSEIETEREAVYAAGQEKLHQEREENRRVKRLREEKLFEENHVREEKRRKLAEDSKKRREDKKLEEDRSRRERLGLPKLENTEDSEGPEQNDPEVNSQEIIKNLRHMGEPAVLFGESHMRRLKRYKKLINVITDGPIPTILQLVDEKHMKLDGTVPKEKEKRRYLFRQLASYFTMILREWDQTLTREKQETKASRDAFNAMIQSREHMKPVCQSLVSCLSYVVKSTKIACVTNYFSVVSKIRKR